MTGANNDDTSDMTVMSVFNEGPAVSLKGSPTVSPTTPALWASEPTPPNWPVSMYFLALSQRPPALDINNAKITPAKMEPPKKPPSASGPRMKPTSRGRPSSSGVCTNPNCITNGSGEFRIPATPWESVDQ